jgi:hypothetical protein
LTPKHPTAAQTAALAAIPTDEIRQIAIDMIVNTETARAEVAAANYSRRVTLRRDASEVILTVAPADSGTSWDVTGAGYTHRGGGHTDVGGVHSRYFGDLADAKAYANGWVESLTGKGYRIAA